MDIPSSSPPATAERRLAARQGQLDHLDRLGDQIATLAAEIHAATARFLRLVEEFDRLKGWNEACCKSCAHWISWRCGIDLGAAREHVRVARRLAALPLIRASIERGELSYSKVRALTRMDDVEREQELLDLARTATASQLERMVRAYRGVVAVQSGHIRDDRFLSIVPDDDGSFSIRGRLRAEEGALLHAILRTAKDALFRELDQDLPAVSPDAHPEAHTHTRPGLVDALMRVAESFSPDGGATAIADRFQVVVHIDHDALSARDGVAALGDGTPLATETVRRVCCDAAVLVTSERNGRTTRFGRKTRTVPPALRRALRRRDGGCRFPGCHQCLGVDAHHIEHWAHGGSTDLDNLVELCRHHHRLLHEGRYSVARKTDGTLSFHRPDGRVVEIAPAPPRRANPACVEQRNRRDGITAHRSTCGSPGAGDRMDLALAVDALLRYAPIPELSVGRSGAPDPGGTHRSRSSSAGPGPGEHLEGGAAAPAEA